MASISVSAQLGALAARFENKLLTEQINASVPSIGSGALEKKRLKGRVAYINVYDGGLDSTKWIGDNDSLAEGSGVDFLQGTVLPKAIAERISIGRIAAATLDGTDDSVDLIEEHLRLGAKNIARKLGRALFSTTLATASAGAAWSSGEATVSFTDVNGFREGDSVLFLPSPDGYGDNDVFVVRVKRVNRTGACGGTVVFANTVQGISSSLGGSQTNQNLTDHPVSAGDAFHQRGKFAEGVNGSQAASGDVPNSFSDIAGTDALHGLDTDDLGSWTGNTFSSFGALTAESLLNANNRIVDRSEEEPTHLILSNAGYTAYCAGQLTVSSSFMGLTNAGQVTRNVDGKLDKYGSATATFLGRPVIREPNMMCDQAIMHNKDAVYLGEWKKNEVEKDGSNAAMIDRSRYGYDIQMSSIVNLCCNKRSAIGLITGITTS